MPDLPFDPDRLDDPALESIERKLSSLSPTPLSDAQRARLLTPPLVGEGPVVRGRRDRTLRIAFPIACAACLALGFLAGAVWQVPVGPPTPTSITTSAPTDRTATVLVADAEVYPEELLSVWRETGSGPAAEVLIDAGAADDVMPRLGDLYTEL
jgi:hypothetical protein